MSGSFESVRWNTCVHRLELGLFPHRTEFLGNGVRTHVNSKLKIPSTGKKFSPEENGTHDVVLSRTASPTHYQRTIPPPSPSLTPVRPVTELRLTHLPDNQPVTANSVCCLCNCLVYYVTVHHKMRRNMPDGDFYVLYFLKINSMLFTMVKFIFKSED